MINLALIGASGTVGKKIIKLLEKKNLKLNNFYPIGNSSVGKRINYKDKSYKVENLETFDVSKVNLAIFSAGSDVAKKYAKKFVENNVNVIDLSSEFRFEDTVPLIIPEINGHVLEDINYPALIANPNCSTSQMLMVLKPIHSNYEIELVNVSTYQAVSGTGKDAINELKNQTYDETSEPSVYPKKIARNVIPQCDVFLDNNFTKEEMKLTWETKKILDSNIHVQATCVRVPVENGHSESVFIKTKKSVDREKVIELLNKTSGVMVVDDPLNLKYPTPLEYANDTEDVYVGRIRSEVIKGENWLSLWIVADNVYGKGAALNAVQILQKLLTLDTLC